MRTIRLLHACLGHGIGDVVEARTQDAVLLISRGWAIDATDKPKEVKAAAPMTTKTIIKKK